MTFPSVYDLLQEACKGLYMSMDPESQLVRKFNFGILWGLKGRYLHGGSSGSFTASTVYLRYYYLNLRIISSYCICCLIALEVVLY